MKRTLLKLSLAMGLLFLPFIENRMVAQNGIQIEIEASATCNNDNREHFPHRAPAHHADYGATATFNPETGLLNLLFYIEDDSALIEIYKDGNVVITETSPLNTMSQFQYDLSSFGTGHYEIIVITSDDEELQGEFDY